MPNVMTGLTKDGLVTDECDPAEDGYLGRSKSSESTMPSGKAFKSIFSIRPGGFMPCFPDTL